MKNHSILLAEDDNSLVRILKRMFEEKGLKIYDADNGESALELFHKHKPSIVLMDIEMPEMDGWQVLENIRKEDQIIPVIIMTGRKTELEDSLYSYDKGATFFLRKPFHSHEVIAMVESQIKMTYGLTNAITFAQFQLNMSSYTISKDNETYNLTEREAKVLYMLAKKANQIVESSNILMEIWYDESSSNKQMLKNTIAKLRKIVECDDVKIEAMYGRGYILNVKNIN